jgi:hypothetical protein
MSSEEKQKAIIIDASEIIIGDATRCVYCGKPLPAKRPVYNLFGCDECEEFRKTKPKTWTVGQLQDAIRQKKFDELVSKFPGMVIESDPEEIAWERARRCPRYPAGCDKCPSASDERAECSLWWVKRRLSRETNEWIENNFRNVKE